MPTAVIFVIIYQFYCKAGKAKAAEPPLKKQTQPKQVWNSRAAETGRGVDGPWNDDRGARKKNDDGDAFGDQIDSTKGTSKSPAYQRKLRPNENSDVD